MMGAFMTVDCGRNCEAYATKPLKPCPFVYNPIKKTTASNSRKKIDRRTEIPAGIRLTVSGFASSLKPSRGAVSLPTDL